MNARHAILLPSFLLLSATGFAAEPAAPVPVSAAPAKTISGLDRFSLLGIAKAGGTAAAMIEMPAGAGDGRIRRLFHEGDKIPGCGCVVAKIGADSVTLERNGASGTLRLLGGGAAVEAPAAVAKAGESRKPSAAGVAAPAAKTPRAGNAAAWPGGRSAVNDYQKMDAAGREAARKQLGQFRTELEAAREQAVAKASASASFMQTTETGLKAAEALGAAYAAADKADAARAAGDAKGEEALRGELEDGARALDGLEARQNAAAEQGRRLREGTMPASGAL